MGDERAARYRDVFAVGQFRVLWLAHAQSRVGDQLARVALSVLVFDRTHSAAWTALTYAMTILPSLAGGALLSGLADRFDRRWVMVAADVVRAALVAVMAVPGQPIAVLVGLLCLVQLPFAPFSAARNAVLPKLLSGDRFVVGLAVMRTTDQLGLVGGIAVGAALVTTLGTHTTLVIDAVTFAVSALLIVVGVRSHRPEGAGDARSPKTWWRSLTAGFRLVGRDARLRALVAIACVNGFYVIPESLAVPYAAQIHGGTGAVGWLLAAIPAGSVLGMVWLKGVRPDLRTRLMPPLAVATCAVLVPTALMSGQWGLVLAVTTALWALSGFASAHDMVVQAEFVRRVPDSSRGQAIGLAGAAMQTAQGLGIVLAGLLAQWLTPAIVVGLAGATGVAAAAAAGVAWLRAASPRPESGRGEAGDLDVAGTT
ncbi:MFS transporter [Actinokineospora inagensis]|uniref:MFS transporter n=1 Tax=Actinokineospora inagensis TaxID=103730 RepID=UPI001FE1DA52|nr:MFS transporter [Actinokineospora inagensis]